MLLENLLDFFSRHAQVKKFWVGYSGGMDSQVLLSLCLALRRHVAFDLGAIHINHHLSPRAATWLAHAREYCQQNAIPFIERHVTLERNAGMSLEEEAREKRYAAFAGCLETGDALLTAHHQEDQAETALIQLLRGSGPKGLAAMPEWKPFAAGFHGRPLLEVGRDALRQFADEHRLTWVDDESNNDTSLLRNYIRHQVMPLLVSRLPAAARTISRSAAHCAEAQVLLEEFGIASLCEVSGSVPGCLSVNKLLTLSAGRQRHVLRAWISQSGYPVPDTRKLNVIRLEALLAAEDRFPCVTWDEDVALRRFRDDLYLLRQSTPPPKGEAYSWHPSEPLYLPGVGILSARVTVGAGLRSDIQSVTIRFRQGGEMLDAPGRGRLALKNLFQEWGVPPWKRGSIPLVFLGDKCIGIVGYLMDGLYQAKAGEAGYLPELV